MRITYVSGSRIPSVAANSVHVMKMCAAFASQGHETTLLAQAGSFTCSDVFSYYGVHPRFDIVWKRRPAHKAGAILYGKRAGSWIRGQNAPDVVYGRCLYGILAARNAGKCLVYEAHAPPRLRVHWLLEKMLLRHSSLSRLVVISHALKREYLRLFPWLDESLVLVAPDGADPLPDEQELGSVDTWPGRPQCIQVGYVGHLYPGRGIEVIADLARRMPRVDFHVIGGTDNDVARWKSVCAEANMHFHGFFPHGNLLPIMTRLDVVLAPYQRSVGTAGGKADTGRWMSPLKVFEYMAVGKAIVASDLPVLREILRDQENALLCGPEDVDAWEKAIRVLQQNSHLRTTLGRVAQEEFLERYTWKQRARAVVSGLEDSTISPKGSRGTHKAWTG